jgi:deoxyadenosine/deoxycytidine kinase
MNKVKITISGPVGSGKTALANLIESAMKWLPVQRKEMDPTITESLTNSECMDYLKMYKPEIEIVEVIAREGEKLVVLSQREIQALKDLLSDEVVRRHYTVDAGNGDQYAARISTLEKLLDRAK